jgi:hypothetical protein
MIPPGPPGPRPALGWPIRKEDWYYITDELVTCTVVVYPGELVSVPEKVWLQLKNGEVRDSTGEREDVMLVKYDVLVPILEKNGFVRL